ncbi:MAG: aminotransferase class V-fold PLP-dependent enzyme [Phycisphaerales bacterium]|nr:aminotransferase class V-fold PLP-dependent enzyme [Phycisphaerales bacterium]
MPDLIYLDHNATTQPADEVVEAMTQAVREAWHNPSSGYRPAQRARQLVDLAREAVGELLGCRDRDVLFTSGGTESDTLALRGALAARPGRTVIVTARTEHSAVRDTAETLAEEGVEVVWLPLDERGLIRLDSLDELLAARADAIALVSVMWANNETGIIQPIEEIGRRCRERDVWLHTDAVQWVGKMPTDLRTLPIDLLSFSAHKFHGPKGAGGLFVRPGVRLIPQQIGAQERRRRGGTENVPGILGLGAAARLANTWLATDGRVRQEALRDDFERRLCAAVPEAVVNSGAAPRMWNTANVGFRRMEGEAVLLLLSERGLCVSAGAACSSGSLEPSPVLLAMGVPPDVAHGSVRFSLARDTTPAEIDTALERIPAAIDRLRGSMSALG